MKILLASIAVLLWACTIGAQNCDGTDCDSCTTINGCGWCAPTQTCLAGNKTGPNTGVCIGSAWEFGKCTPCQLFSDCRSCNERETDCFWCATSNNGVGACMPLGFVGCDYDRTCPCDVYASCYECTNDVGCQWCGTSETCIAIAPNSTCTAGPSFNYTTSCPCGANLDCQNCRQTSGCQWCDSGLCSANCAGPVEASCAVYCQDVAASCSGCVEARGCAWCDSLNQCVDEASSPCETSKTCPNCQLATYCDTCLSVSGCQWCEDSLSCQQIGQNATCFVAHTCESYCESFEECHACSAATGCAWCEDTNKCADISTANCFLTHTCSPSCTLNANCGTCLLEPECVWCEDTNQCVNATGATCFLAHTCGPVGNCVEINDCSTCNGDSGCQWCGDIGCQNLGTKCLVDMTCGEKVSGHKFSGSSFVGGMFFVIGVIVVGAGGYIFYRWRTGRKFDYRELK